MMIRLVKGFDSNLLLATLASGNWTGTPAYLHAGLAKVELLHPILPIRDAVDFVHSCIHSTIKALKFSAGCCRHCSADRSRLPSLLQIGNFAGFDTNRGTQRSSRGPFDVRKDSCTNHQTQSLSVRDAAKAIEDHFALSLAPSSEHVLGACLVILLTELERTLGLT